MGELVDTVVARLLDHLDVPNDLMRRWEGLAPRALLEPVED
jgi:4-hydroxy-3-polyprenylbenzoate decarboxylase